MPRVLKWGDRLPSSNALEPGSAEAQRKGCSCARDQWLQSDLVDGGCWLHGREATALLAGACLCKSCLREGMHDPDCSVHLADNEALAKAPCDCGLRDGVKKAPAGRLIPDDRSGKTLPN
jgi:hypothetical protein